VTDGVLRIGGDSLWGDYFNGLINEVRIYNNALTAAQVQADMNTAIYTAPIVTDTDPAAGSVVFAQPTSFTVHVSDPLTPATVDAGDFQVNGIGATSVSYAPGSTTITFSYAGSPVTAEGVQTMHIDAGAFTRAGDG